MQKVKQAWKKDSMVEQGPQHRAQMQKEAGSRDGMPWRAIDALPEYAGMETGKSPSYGNQGRYSMTKKRQMSYSASRRTRRIQGTTDQSA